MNLAITSWLSGEVLFVSLIVRDDICRVARLEKHEFQMEIYETLEKWNCYKAEPMRHFWHLLPPVDESISF